ncbi:MAG: hypothetical protein RJB60_2939 [Pseudomonadota bacterium]|jgi:hypothetical protein
MSKATQEGVLRFVCVLELSGLGLLGLASLIQIVSGLY